MLRSGNNAHSVDTSQRKELAFTRRQAAAVSGAYPGCASAPRAQAAGRNAGRGAERDGTALAAHRLMIRPPAVAGMFYENSPARLAAQVEACFAANAPVAATESFIGAVVPHAGLMYSGPVAAAFYAAVRLPRRLLILCPNHTGNGHPAAINCTGSWRTPLGDVAIDEPLARTLMQRSRLIRADGLAHAREHSLEVQLPFLQHLMGSEFTMVPLCLATNAYELCEEIGIALAGSIADSGEPIGILASSDLNHYEDQATTLRKDQLAIDAMLSLDARALWHVVAESEISMCGFIPATTMLIAAKALGATTAKLIRHATSGDVSGDFERVVGYASMLFT